MKDIYFIYYVFNKRVEKVSGLYETETGVAKRHNARVEANTDSGLCSCLITEKTVAVGYLWPDCVV